MVSTDDTVSVAEAIEEKRHTSFDKAKSNIKKAQEHQAKGYNKCQTQGTPFDVGQKVLKCNFFKGCLKKLKSRYIRQYEITSRLEKTSIF